MIRPQPIRTICHIIHDYYPSVGGAEIQTKNLAEGLSQRGYENLVFTKRVKRQYPLTEVVNGVRIVRKAYPPTNYTLPLKLIGAIKNFYYLLVNRKKYQIIHLKAPFLEFLIPCWLLKKLIGTPVVYALSISREVTLVQGKRFAGIKHLIKRSILSSFDAVITMNREMANEARSFGIRADKLHHIINGVESDRFVPDATKRISGRVIFIGRIDRNKGLDTLLEAWLLFIEKHKNCQLTIAGPQSDSEHAEQLTKFVATNKLSSSVSFLPPIDYFSAAIVDYFQSAELFVLPSRLEGMPGTLLQAMSCGLPVVSTNVPGAIDLIDDGKNGYLVNIDDPAALAEAMSAFFNLTEGHRAGMGQYSRRIIETEFGQEKRVDQFLELLRSIDV